MTTYPLLACQALLMAVFGLAAVSKLTRRGFGEFVAATGRLLPARWSRGRRPVALGVLAAEIALKTTGRLTATVAGQRHDGPGRALGGPGVGRQGSLA